VSIFVYLFKKWVGKKHSQQAVETEQSPVVEPELAQAVTAATAPAFDVTGLKEEFAPEIVPLVIPEVEETEQAIIPPITDVESKGASPSCRSYVNSLLRRK
jgi:hypothetical protein